MDGSQIEPLLTYLERDVLQHLRGAPDRYLLEEDDMGGRVRSLLREGEDAATVNALSVRFAFRRLADGRVCIAAFGLDLARMSGRQRAIWHAHTIPSPVFALHDPNFERWVRRYLKGSWEVENGPLPTMRAEIELLCALTHQILGWPLWRAGWNPLVNYPTAENTDAYAKACLELYRVLIDGLDVRVVAQIAQRCSVAPSDATKSLNTLKETLPGHLVPVVHAPLKKLADARNTQHGVPSSAITAFPAFDTFHEGAAQLRDGLTALRLWLEGVLLADAHACLRREQVMANHFPKLIGPPRPEFKLARVERAIGKTIRSVEFGEVEPHPDAHAAEAMIFHFTDGSAMAIIVGSNAGNISDDYEDIRTSDFHTDLVPIWAPAVDAGPDQ